MTSLHKLLKDIAERADARLLPIYSADKPWQRVTCGIGTFHVWVPLEDIGRVIWDTP